MFLMRILWHRQDIFPTSAALTMLIFATRNGFSGFETRRSIIDTASRVFNKWIENPFAARKFAVPASSRRQRTNLVEWNRENIKILVLVFPS